MVDSYTGTDNVSSVVPMLLVADLERSVRYYSNGLGFTVVHTWLPDGKLRWCWMALGGAALMLQQLTTAGRDEAGMNPTLGVGSSLYFQCQDAVAIYRQVVAHGIQATEPQVGNGNWETFLVDPDGYKINFTSPASYPEETLLSQIA